MGSGDLLRRISEEISETVFPSNIYCAVCGSLIDRSRPYALCDECITQMHWITGNTCGICGKALPDTYRGFDSSGRQVCYDCMSRSHYFTRGWSCMSYGLHEREIMMDIKYSGKGYLARKMGDVMFDRMEVLIEEARECGLRPFDVVIPVPVNKKRLVKRGYNQSEIMARQFIRRWSAAERAEGAGRPGGASRRGGAGRRDCISTVSGCLCGKSGAAIPHRRTKHIACRRYIYNRRNRRFLQQNASRGRRVRGVPADTLLRGEQETERRITQCQNR